MATPYQERKIADPELNPGDKPYFDAAAEGKLMLKKCNACGEMHHYPRALCPFCFGDCEWEQASGKGKVYTYSIMERANPPYAIGYVTLEEGPSVLTNFVEMDFKDLKIGQDMKVTFIQTEGDGPTMPFFTPA